MQCRSHFRALARFYAGWVVLAIVVGWPISARPADFLRVGKPDATGFDFSILQVGIDANIFKKYDLEIEPVTLSGSAKLHQGMISNSIDIALGAGTDFSFIAKGAPEKGVAAMGGAPLNIGVLIRPEGRDQIVG